MTADELLDHAQHLLNRSSGRTEADLRRAGSAAYYALFHELSRRCANMIMGAAPTGQDLKAWQQSYRCIEHKHIVHQVVKKKRVLTKFGTDLQDFANSMNDLQDIRHTCDYDPHNTPTATDIEKSIKKAQSALNKIRNADQDEAKRLCVFLMFKHRN